MCGIAGIFSPTHHISDGVRNNISHVGKLLKHRGPDECNDIALPHFCAVHARLAIIDLKNGQQPMLDEDTGNIIVFNGEIYNYIEIRDELIKKGVRFRTNSDTEVLLRGYAILGREILNIINGMFAFAIYDKNHNTVFLAKDRFGEKPLYYFQNEDNFFFASEITALRGFKSCPNSISTNGIISYLASGYIEGPDSILSGVSQLNPGSYLVVDTKGTVSQKQYYRVNWHCDVEKDFSDEEIFESLQDTIKLRLRSDVPVASFLSGGVDSTIITTIAQQLSDRPLRTYTFGMTSNTGEIPIARKTAHALGTEHKEVMLDFSFKKHDILKIIKSMDMPFADSALIPVYELSRIVSADGIKVVLSGEGGDELFGGYPWYKRNLTLKAKIKEFVIGHKRRQAEYLHGKLIFNSEMLSKAFNAGVFESYFNSRLGELLVFEESVNGKIGFDYEHFLAWDLLPKVDRMSMAHSLEVRVPFLDHRLVEAWACVGVDNKVNNNTTKYRITKFALDKNIVTEEQLKQGKVGLNLPLNKWVRENENLIRDVIFCTNSLTSAIFEKNKIEAWLLDVRDNTPVSSWTVNSQRLWTLFVLDAWHAQFIH